VPAIRRFIGADLDQGLVYALDSTRTLVAIDLRARRARVLRKGVRNAALGPDGTLFAVDTSGKVTEVRGRRPITLTDALPAGATSLVGTAAGRLLVLPTARRADLTVFEPEGPSETIAVPAGFATSTLAGDLVAVAVDSAVVLADPSGARKPDVIDVSGHARAVMFSPSGHRLYVGRDDDDVMAFDRYSARERDGIDVPGGAIALRGDLYGLWMLVRSRKGDTLSVVDLTARSVVARTVTDWDDDLPLIAPSLPAARPEGTRRGRARPGARRASSPRPGSEGGGRHLGPAGLGARGGGGGRGRRCHRYDRDTDRLCHCRVGPAILPAGEQLQEPGLGPGARREDRRRRHQGQRR
jgi:hypothetical protein